MKELVLNVMRRGAVTCSEDTPIREVAQIMVYNRIRYCIVLTKNQEIKGIISARSILKAFNRDLDSLAAKDILLSYTITIHPYHHLSEAIDLMKKKHIEHLIVVSDTPGSKAVYGILNASDLVSRMAQSEKRSR